MGSEIYSAQSHIYIEFKKHIFFIKHSMGQTGWTGEYAIIE